MPAAVETISESISKATDLNDVILEALEVFINHILYVRDLYPSQIFKKRRIYNAPVFVSIYPPLNTYLYKALKTCKELLKSSELERLEVLFYKDDSKEYERYKFDIKSLEKNAINEDEFLMDFEEQIRSSLCRLSERMKYLEKLPSDAKFRILIYTTHSTFIKLTHNSNYQEFPWLRYDIKPTQVKTQISLLPLTSVDSIGLSLSADIL